MSEVQIASGVDVLRRLRSGRAPRDLHYLWFVGFVALLYGTALSQIPDEGFKDFANYLIYAESSLVILLSRLSEGPLGLLANEPVWLLINASLSAFFEPEAVVRLIIFFSAISVAWQVLINYPRHFGILIIFLLLPAVVKNNLIHIRQGLAIAIFLLGWYSKGKPIRWFLLAISPLVHASFFFVLAFLFFSKALRYLNLNADIQTAIFFAFGFTMGYGVWLTAAYFGARQAEESQLAAEGISGLGFVFWFFMFVVWLSSGKGFLRKFNFETALLVFYLSTYWILGVSARIFESVLLLVLLGSLSMPSTQRKIFVASIASFGCLMWLLRAGSPAMGFGIGD